MEFVDVSQFKIVTMRRYSTLKLVVDGDRYLDLSVREGLRYIEKLMSVNFKSPSVYYQITLKLNSDELDDFETICENIVSAIFRHNCLDEKRSEKDKKLVLNKLPSNNWALKLNFVNRVNCDDATLFYVADHLYRNRNIFISIDTENGHFKYELIGVENNNENTIVDAA